MYFRRVSETYRELAAITSDEREKLIYACNCNAYAIVAMDMERNME